MSSLLPFSCYLCHPCLIACAHSHNRPAREDPGSSWKKDASTSSQLVMIDIRNLWHSNHDRFYTDHRCDLDVLRAMHVKQTVMHNDATQLPPLYTQQIQNAATTATVIHTTGSGCRRNSHPCTHNRLKLQPQHNSHPCTHNRLKLQPQRNSHPCTHNRLKLQTQAHNRSGVCIHTHTACIMYI